MHHSFTPTGVCSRRIDFDITDDGKVSNVRFTGGCPGNTLGVGILAEGRTPAELIALLKGIGCKGKPTSCPDQLACALAKAVAK